MKYVIEPIRYNGIDPYCWAYWNVVPTANIDISGSYEVKSITKYATFEESDLVLRSNNYYVFKLLKTFSQPFAYIKVPVEFVRTVLYREEK